MIALLALEGQDNGATDNWRGGATHLVIAKEAQTYHFSHNNHLTDVTCSIWYPIPKMSPIFHLGGSICVPHNTPGFTFWSSVDYRTHQDIFHSHSPHNYLCLPVNKSRPYFQRTRWFTDANSDVTILIERNCLEPAAPLGLDSESSPFTSHPDTHPDKAHWHPLRQGGCNCLMFT